MTSDGDTVGFVRPAPGRPLVKVELHAPEWPGELELLRGLERHAREVVRLMGDNRTSKQLVAVAVVQGIARIDALLPMLDAVRNNAL